MLALFVMLLLFVGLCNTDSTEIQELIELLCDEFTNAQPPTSEWTFTEGLPSDRAVCETRVKALHKRIVEDHPLGFTPFAVENAYKAYLHAPYESGRYKGFDQSDRGLRIQIINREVWYYGQPDGRYDSLQYIEPTLTMFARTVSMYETPNVDFTTMFGDVCPPKRDSKREVELRQLKVEDREDEEGYASLRDEVAPVFAYGSADDCYAIPVPLYDFMWDVQNFMGGSSWRADANADDLPWERKETDAVWRGQVFGSRMRVRVAAACLLYPELLNAHFTGFSKNLKYDRAWCNDLWLQNEEPVPLGTPASHVPELEPELPEIRSPSGEVTQEINRCEETLGNQVPFYLFLDHKYLVDVDGWGSTFRFKNLLLSGAAVFKVENNMYQFFYQELKPYVHFIPIRRDRIIEELPKKIMWAKNNDTWAHMISDTSTRYMQRHVTDQHANWYQHAAMTIYARHMTYKISKPGNGFKRFCCSQLTSHIYKRYCVDGAGCQEAEEKHRQVEQAAELQDTEDAFNRDLESFASDVAQFQTALEDIQESLKQIKETQLSINSDMSALLKLSGAQANYSVNVLKVMYQQMVLHVGLQLEEIKTQLPQLNNQNQQHALSLIHSLTSRMHQFNQTTAEKPVGGQMDARARPMEEPEPAKQAEVDVVD
eukprot:TRINITY_DN77250_c0_g1_i1.p1 TRINITY_DN77250_c0_g1~~TRINITY_DN77250_c0_g1_i1.p1  ORF type:complete len:655 (+),score=57.28 TRINITY_DN77250_c0_g1_i1:42-2006(+)